jgi:hypothetical protein
MKALCSTDRYCPKDFQDMCQEVTEARNAILGTHDERKASPGKVAFEHHPRAEPINNAPRCYGFSSMVQQPRQLGGPPASLKVIDDALDDFQTRVSRYTQVCFDSFQSLFHVIIYL